jgi:transcriptional regulator with XRE-family HTH domain
VLSGSRSSFKPKKFHDWRRKLGLGQKEIARRLRYAVSSISQIESGKQRPTARFLELLQRVYGVRPETFFSAFFSALMAASLFLTFVCRECAPWLWLHLPH